MTDVVTFDIADSSFNFYTKEEWDSTVKQWRDDLIECGYDFAQEMDEEEIVDLTYGDELSFTYLPEASK